MIEVKLDQQEIEDKFTEELRKRLNELESRTVYWDMKELCRQTCMSEPVIREQFFYDERFPKFKVGRRWLFPARETEEFLRMWIKEQPTY